MSNGPSIKEPFNSCLFARLVWLTVTLILGLQICIHCCLYLRFKLHPTVKIAAAVEVFSSSTC